MSAPVPIKVSGPPPGPPPRAPKAPRQIKPRPAAPANWGPPTTAPVSLAPPIVKKPYEGIVTRSEYTCLTREDSDSKLTACGRLLFLPAISVTDDPAQVTCCFCQMRIKAQVA